MARFLRKILILCILLVITAFVLDHLFTGIFREGNTVKAQWLSRMEGRHYDLAITGSSRAWWNIDVNEINRRCSIDAISMANNHFTPSEILLSLKVFLANGNTVDRILLQADYRSLSTDQDDFSSTVYDYLPWLEDSVVYNHLRPRSKEWMYLRHIPFARYARYNFRWGVEEALITELDMRRTIFDSTGSFFMDQQFRGWPELFFLETNYAPDEDMQAIIALCEEHGIELELFIAPYYRLRLPPDTKERFDRMVARLEVPMHDFTHRLDSTLYFENNWHLNLEGGRRFTTILTDEVICLDRADKNREAVPVE